MISKKVILLGHFGVGKTSLIKRFVHQKFSDDYITTIGVKIDKKIVKVDDMEISILIWDIAGEHTRQKIPESYKLGAHGTIFVFDVTRPSSYEQLAVDIEHMHSVLPPVPFLLVGNKTDLVDKEEIAALKQTLPEAEYFFTSAKNGDHVDKVFRNLTRMMVP
ncbi:MAG: Rab family GTPase [Bacteroidota bacterium]